MSPFGAVEFFAYLHIDLLLILIFYTVVFFDTAVAKYTTFLLGNFERKNMINYF